MDKRPAILRISSEEVMKWSLLYLHVLLAIFAIAILNGREASIIGDMFSVTLWAIVLNLGVISGNKALQKVADKMPGRTNKGTEV